MRGHHTSAFDSWKDGELQVMEYKFSIAVGIDCPRAKLRVSILLDTIQEYHVNYISSEEEISEVINNADLIIGAGDIACGGIIHQKPVIVVGEYGMGGLVTPHTLRDQYCNCFKGKINGIKKEYFPLAMLEGEIQKGLNLTSHELRLMSIQALSFETSM